MSANTQPSEQPEDKPEAVDQQEAQRQITERVNYLADAANADVATLNVVKYLIDLMLKKDGSIIFDSSFLTDVDFFSGKAKPVKKEYNRIRLRCKEPKKNEQLGSFEVPDALNLLKSFLTVYHGNQDVDRLYSAISNAWLDQISARRADITHHPKEKTPINRVELIFHQVNLRNGESLEQTPWVEVEIIGIQDVLDPKRGSVFVAQHRWILSFNQF